MQSLFARTTISFMECLRRRLSELVCGILSRNLENRDEGILSVSTLALSNTRWRCESQWLDEDKGKEITPATTRASQNGSGLIPIDVTRYTGYYRPTKDCSSHRPNRHYPLPCPPHHQDVSGYSFLAMGNATNPGS